MATLTYCITIDLEDSSEYDDLKSFLENYPDVTVITDDPSTPQLVVESTASWGVSSTE